LAAPGKWTAIAEIAPGIVFIGVISSLGGERLPIHSSALSDIETVIPDESLPVPCSWL